MIKVICDACGCEKAKNKFEYLCHLDDNNPVTGYTDNNGNAVSGRSVSVDLCNKCYNDILSKAVAEIKWLSKNRNIEGNEGDKDEKTKRVELDDEKTPKPNVGDKIYVGSSISISNGSNDFCGGLSIISKVYKSMSAGKMVWFIETEEGDGRGWNYAMLIEDDTQKELKKRFGESKAHPDPDIDTPWIEDGDFVDGKVYHGEDIW